MPTVTQGHMRAGPSAAVRYQAKSCDRLDRVPFSRAPRTEAAACAEVSVLPRTRVPHTRPAHASRLLSEHGADGKSSSAAYGRNRLRCTISEQPLQI